MALEDEVKQRLSVQLVLELTNPDDETATLVDDARLSEAAEDVIADIATYVGIVFDVNEDQHVSVAINGVKLKLLSWATGADTTEIEQSWLEALKALRMVTLNDRIIPKTSSKLTPADEAPGGITVRPDFDRNSSFDSVSPSRPTNGRSVRPRL